MLLSDIFASGAGTFWGGAALKCVREKSNSGEPVEPSSTLLAAKAAKECSPRRKPLKRYVFQRLMARVNSCPSLLLLFLSCSFQESAFASGGLLPRGGSALPDVGDQQKKQASGAIEQNVPWGTGAGRDETLVPFIHGSNESSSRPGEQRCRPQPRMHLMERGPPSAQQQQAQHAVAQDVSRLAEVMMKDEEVVEIDFAEQTRQQRIQQAPCILRREEIGGFKGDQADPNDGRPPGAQKIGTGRRQAIPGRSWEPRG